MKPVPHFLPPRSAVIFAHVRAAVASTGLNLRKMSATIAETYVALVEPEERTVPFRSGVTVDDIFKAEKHNAQVMARYMDGTVKVLPADLEDAVVLSLPEPHRSNCERDLARRRSILAVPMPDGTEAGDNACLARVYMEFGQFVESLAPALADGRICEADLPHARRIFNESDDVITAIMALRERVQWLVDPAGMTANGLARE